jgi:hypothetical protein
MPPSFWRRTAMRRAEAIIAVQELLLLLLVGVSSTLLAVIVDKFIDELSAFRTRVSHDAGGFVASYLTWIGSALVFNLLSAACVQFLGPSAAGSGIPQMKCVLAGVEIHDYLSMRTLVAKVASLVLALAGGLSIGKEGPYVHIASCLAHQLCRLPPFRRWQHNEELRHEVLAAACAAGVSATFGAPVGGVLFSIEVTSSSYSVQHLWKAMFTSVCGALVFRVSRDNGSLALFRLTEFVTHDLGSMLFNGEMVAFASLGVLSGVGGAAFVHATASLVRTLRRVRALVEAPPEPPPSTATPHQLSGDAAARGAAGSAAAGEAAALPLLPATEHTDRSAALRLSRNSCSDDGGASPADTPLDAVPPADDDAACEPSVVGSSIGGGSRSVGSSMIVGGSTSMVGGRDSSSMVVARDHRRVALQTPSTPHTPNRDAPRSTRRCGLLRRRVAQYLVSRYGYMHEHAAPHPSPPPATRPPPHQRRPLLLPMTWQVHAARLARVVDARLPLPLLPFIPRGRDQRPLRCCAL